MLLLAQIADASAQDCLCRVQVLFLDLKNLRAAANWVYQDARNEGYRDTGVVAANCEVDKIPALRPSVEARARGELDDHEDIVQNRRDE